VSDANDSPKRPGVPPPQDNLVRAIGLAHEALTDQGDEQLLWLGAGPSGNGWRLPVLGETLQLDQAARRLATSTGREVGPHWTILVLHYLAIRSRPEKCPPETTFADLATARSYAGVYQGRVISRLCYTAGRDLDMLSAAAVGLGGQGIEAADSADAAFDFQVFPQLSLRLIWYAADDEFPPSATLLLPANIESYFCPEDIVVLSESLVARLGGRPF